MKAYHTVRDWVDRLWRAPGLQVKILLLPAILPVLVVWMIAKGPILHAGGWAWFGLWTTFIIWRYVMYMNEVSRETDKKYDNKDKFRLAQESHDTESATAAAERKRNS